MLIRSKLYRPGGTRVALGKGKDARHYHFKALLGHKDDDPQHEHVCDITNADDVATLVAIKEGYEIHPSEISSKVKAKAPAPAKVTTSATESSPPAPKKPYASLNKPELLKLVGERTGKQPHGSTARSKLIEQLEALDKQSS
jgi:hypothetical protein